MAVAGAAWAVYTLAGRSSREPVAANARNFLWSSPLALLVVLAAPAPSSPARAASCWRWSPAA